MSWRSMAPCLSCGRRGATWTLRWGGLCIRGIGTPEWLCEHVCVNVCVGSLCVTTRSASRSVWCARRGERRRGPGPSYPFCCSVAAAGGLQLPMVAMSSSGESPGCTSERYAELPASPSGRCACGARLQQWLQLYVCTSGGCTLSNAIKTWEHVYSRCVGLNQIRARSRNTPYLQDAVIRVLNRSTRSFSIALGFSKPTALEHMHAHESSTRGALVSMIEAEQA